MQNRLSVGRFRLRRSGPFEAPRPSEFCIALMGLASATGDQPPEPYEPCGSYRPTEPHGPYEPPQGLWALLFLEAR